MASSKPAGAIGYILRRFPVLSETFILNEILALEARGIPVHIFSLAPSRDPRVHEDLSRLKASVTYIPEVADLKTLLSSNLRAAACYRRQYLRALFYALTRGHSTVLWRFLQSGYVANQAQQLCLRQFHAHFATRPASVALLTSMITGIPYSFTAHAYDIYESQVDPTALTQKIDRARWVITISEFNKAYLDQLSPAAAGKIVRIYNGIDLMRFVPNDMRPPVPFTILTVARLVEKKGLPVLIEACRHLRERDVPFRCWIVGKGRLRPRLEEMIAGWNLHDSVSLLG
ncbi:MAG TPA: glycosyltransferase, partial [Candidatus Tectomicrobia bacterium]|nr:glycosyltransferase [Candidatus Tectomicrobia bacterium]